MIRYFVRWKSIYPKRFDKVLDDLYNASKTNDVIKIRNILKSNVEGLKEQKMNHKKLIIFTTFISSLYMYSTNIDDLVLPNGFDISIVAGDLDSPRQLTETKSGHVIVGSKKGSEIIALIDNNNDGYFEERAIVAENLQNPTGVAFHKDDLYFAEIDTVWVIRDIDLWINSKTSELPEKAIYMNNLPSETWHGFKYIDFGPDDNLYIPVGVPCNICIEPQTQERGLQQFISMKMAN